MKRKEKTVLVFGITSNYVFALANTLIGLVKHNNVFWDDIIVYYDKLNKKDMDNINKIVPCKFICFSKTDYLKALSREVLEKYSEASFYRFECFNLLKEYDIVIWNDVDVLIQNDISGLLDYGRKSGFAATKNDIGFMVEANFETLLPEYNMYAPLYNSGILVLTRQLKDYDKIFAWCIKKTQEYGDILRWPDQGILNIMLQEFGIEVEEIDVKKYCCHPSLKNYVNSASIIHAYGDSKFWSDYQLRKQFPEWTENRLKWESFSSSESLDEPLVSCVMSTFMRYDYLKESVESILNQTYSNIELIVVLEKCKNQEKIENILKDVNDSRIKIIKNKTKLGFAASLNVGIEASKGRYIARMDDDDISLPERFMKQVAFMEKHGDVGICGTKAQFFGKCHDVIDVETDAEKLKITTLYKTPFIHPTVMMRADFINKYNLRYDSDYFTEDYDLWSRAVKYLKFANLEDVLLYYRASFDNLTSGSNENKIHSSHKRVVQNQLKWYLGIESNENELELLQKRKDILRVCYNRTAIMVAQKKFYEKIIAMNKKSNFYNQKLLESMLVNDSFSMTKQNMIKRIIKKITYPLYSRLMYRVDARIDQSAINIYDYVNSEISKLKEKDEEK